MGRLKTVSINEKVNMCSNANEESEPLPCCKDVSEELRIDEVTQTSFDFDGQPDLYELAIITWITFGSLPDTFDLDKRQFQYYASPPPDSDFQVSHQVFLI